MAWIIKHIVTICFFLMYYKTMNIDGETIRARPHYKVVNVSSLEPKPNCQRSRSGPKIGSQKLEIVSRFGPCFPNTSRTRTKSSDELLNWDQARVRSINKRVNGHLYSNSLSEDGVDPTIEFGGVYSVKIGLGTPKQDYNLMMDTGSGPTWVRCLSCTKGCDSTDPLYDSSKSSTYTNNSNLCEGTSDPFNVRYGDKSHSNGIWGCDTLTIEGIGAIKNFRFGCGKENVDETGDNFGDVAGILGLGKGHLSLPSQIASSMQVFSYSVPLKNDVEGNLLFGDEAMKKSLACSNQFTPMVKGPNPVYYYLNLVGISVAGNKLNVASTTFTNEGTVIDSGTVITRLPRVVYSAFRTAFRQSMSSYTLLENVDKLMDTCYRFVGQIALPEIKFHFGEGTTTTTTDVTLSDNGILWIKKDRVKCLAFAAKESEEDVSIIGSVQQRGFSVLYDLKRERIGFCR